MVFLMTNENPRICRAMAKIIYDAFEFRQKDMEKMTKTSTASVTEFCHGYCLMTSTCIYIYLLLFCSVLFCSCSQFWP